MQTAVRIVDAYLGKGRTAAIELRLASEKVTARELIRRRVADEVALLQARVESYDKTRSLLVRFDRSAVEAAQNGDKPPKETEVIVAEEVAAAVEAFEARQFIMLFDERQVDALDEAIALTADSEVVFLRLAPLRGG